MNESKLKSFLKEKENELTEKLKSFFEMPIHPDITLAEIQIFLDDESGSNASFWIYFDGKNKKIDKTDKSLFPGRSMEIIELDFFEEDIYEGLEYKQIFDYLDSVADLLKIWFVECWSKSGAQNYQLPIEIAVHDGFGDGKVIKIS